MDEQLEQKAKRRRRALFFLMLLVLSLLCLIAWAPGAIAPSVAAPPAPTITSAPAEVTASPSATFRFGGPSGVTFWCSLDSAEFVPCDANWSFSGLNPGWHTLGVKSVRNGLESPVTTYRWLVEGDPSGSGCLTTSPADAGPGSGDATVESKTLPFTISGGVTNLALGVWKPISVTLHNPNDVAINVTSLAVDVSADSTPSGCRSAQNLELIQSDLSSTQSVAVPANGSVVLPAQGASAPRIRLRNLPDVNQDACKGVSFELTFTGKATS